MKYLKLYLITLNPPSETLPKLNLYLFIGVFVIISLLWEKKFHKNK